MKTINILLFLLSFALISVAQEAGTVAKTLKGKIVNSVTNEAVSYTNIGIEGTLHGTASDNNGNFELKIPEALVTKNIFFSAVGYKNQVFPVKNLFERDFSIIKIEPQSYDIDDVDVAGQSRVLVRILRMAAENTPYNFIQGPFNMVCDLNIRQTINDSIKINDKAEVLMYDKTGYSKPSKLNAFQNLNYRVSKNKSSNDYRFSTHLINIDEMLELDWVRSASSVLNPGILAGFELKLLEEPEIAGKKYWKIEFKQKNPTLTGSGNFYATSFSGEIIVSKEDYSVLQISGSQKSVRNSSQGKSLALGESNSAIENLNAAFEIKYKNLKPDIIRLNKSYLKNGDTIESSAELLVKQVKITQLQVLESRDYFAEK